ncbi:MAG TPA: hypothetical protein VLC98_13405 [Phnomibacter sp.]|nr:hypothetical protein [Phnomibacter sp.]
MSLPAGITPLQLPKNIIENGHHNFKHALKANASFNLRLPLPFDQQVANYTATTKNFQWLIQHAIDNKFSLRALGNNWSFSEVAMADGVIDTKELRCTFQPGPTHVVPAYTATGKTHRDTFFVQCGVSILDLNEKLEKENRGDRCIKASGASNGQTIAGATSTGTHGSAYQVGAVHDAIIGLHIITGPNEHVYIERKSYPVVTQSFINFLGARFIADDDMFNAAVVSFGCFGFVHGVLIETSPKFLLDKRTTKGIPYDKALRLAVNEWDFSGIEPSFPLPVQGPDHHMYHFEVLVNPFQFAPDDPAKGVFLKVIYKKPFVDGYPKPLPNPKYQYGDELLGVISTVLDHLPDGAKEKLVPALVTKLLPMAFNPNESVQGTIGEIFTNTKFRGKAASAAIGVPTQFASAVVEAFVDMNRQFPFAGAVALRFVKGTKALLGFTHFEKTCVLEMDGVDSKTSREFFTKMWDKLDELQIPFTMHWGKINFGLNATRVEKMYGAANIATWKACRHQLLSADCRKVFTNAFMQQCGLNG